MSDPTREALRQLLCAIIDVVQHPTILEVRAAKILEQLDATGVLVGIGPETVTMPLHAEAARNLTIHIPADKLRELVKRWQIVAADRRDHKPEVGAVYAECANMLEALLPLENQ